jgi:hypothetical protein
VLLGSGDRPLIDDADAWRLVLQCAEGKLEFIQLSEELSTRFRERYDYNDWSSTFTELFAAWEEETADGPVGVVKRAMFRRGVSLSGDSRGASASGSASTDTHRTKRRRVASGAQVSRGDGHSPRRRKRAPLRAMTTAAAQACIQMSLS